MPVTPKVGRLMQGDCHMFQTVQGYKQDFVSKAKTERMRHDEKLWYGVMIAGRV